MKTFCFCALMALTLLFSVFAKAGSTDNTCLEEFNSEKLSPAVDFTPGTLFAGFARRSVWLRASMNEAGTIYFVLYDADPGVLTANAVRADALSGIGGSRVGTSSETFSAADVPDNPSFPGTPYSGARFTGLTQGATYYYAIVAFDAAGTNSGTVIQGNDVTALQPCVIGTPDSGQGGSDPNLCGPRTVGFRVSFTGIQYEDPYLLQYGYEFEMGNPLDRITPTLLNPTELNLANQEWEGTNFYTYPDNGTQCTYDALAFLIYNSESVCTNIFQEQTYAVYDDIANNALGQIAIVDPIEGDDEIEVCEGEEVVVTFNNASVINCVDPIEPDIPNTRQRWYQYEYGVNSGDADFMDDVEVDATAAGDGIVTTFPYAGPIEFLATPVDETTPLPATFDIRVLPTNVFGVDDRFVVRLRMWNICNPYDEVLDNPFGTGGLSPESGDFTNGDEDPITDEAVIVLVQQPPIPTAEPKEICNGNALPTFEINIPAPGNFDFVNWYDNDPDLGGVLITQTAVNTLGATVGGVPNNTSSGIYTVWAEYQRPTTGVGTDCVSEAIPTTITIRENLTNPGVITSSSSFPVCADSPNIIFSVPDPPGVGVPGGAWEYEWSFGGGALNDNLNFIGATNGQTVTVDITSAAASGTRRVRVRRRYVNGDDSGDNCESGRVSFDFDIDAVSVGGTVSGGSFLCSGDPSGNITLSSNVGSSIIWQRSVDSGPFTNLGVAFNDLTTISEASLTTPGTVPVTYTYQALVTNGVCSQVTSSSTTFTVNPIPSVPTISGVTDICEDITTTLTATSNAAADSYQWYRNGVAIGGETNPTITLGTVAESGSYTVEAIGIAATNCTSAQSAPTVVTINPLPTASNPTGGGSVCSSNPAPDIIWTLTGTAPFQVTYTDGISTFGPIAEPTNTFTLTNPITVNAGTYQITALTDANTCSGTSLGGVATIVIGGTPPTFDTPPTLSVSDVCDDGGATTDPELLFSLDDAGSASQSGFVLTYNIDGGANRTINFDTDASGGPTANILLNDVELDVTIPSPHVIEIVSIVSPVGCLSTFNIPLNFVVNPRPIDATNPVDGIACSDPGTGVALSVDLPPVNTRIRWYRDMALTIDAVPAFGSISGSATRDEIFVPSASTTFTYYAVVESTVGPTFCQSTGFVAVDITEDPNPDPISAQADDQTCDDFYVLSATAASPAGATGFWSTTGTLYYENFDDQLDDATNDAGQFGWTTDISSLVSFTGPGPNDYFAVRSGRFEGLDLGNASTSAFWFSEIIDVSSITSIDITALLYKNGDLETEDFVEIYYLLDGTPTKFGELVRSVNDDVPPDPALVELPVSSLALDVSGVNNLQLEVRMRSNGGNDIQGFDDIIVREASTSTLTFDDIFDTGTTVRGLQDGVNSVFWNVVSEFGACMPLSEEVIITKIPAPVGVDITDELCEDTFNGTTTAGIDLSVYDGLVTGGVANRIVEWFSNQTRTIAVPLTPAVTGDPIVTVSNGDIFYPLITETVSGDNCINDFSQPGSITFTVFDLPAVADQDISNPETEFCEDTPGSGVFGALALPGIDLTTMDDDVANGIVANRTVSWFVDPTYSTAVPNPNDVEVTNGDVFYARITETASGQSCFNDAQVEITVNTRPGNNDIVGNDFQCVDPSSLQIYQITPGPPGTTYTWTIDPLFTQFGGGTINDPFVILQFPTAGTGNISVVETAAFTNVTCDGDIEIKTITVENAPTGLSIAGPDEVCDSETGVVFSTSSLPNTTYAWTVPVGSSIISGQGSASITVNFGSTGGNVEVIPTSTTGNCSGTVPPKPVTINQRPVLDPNLNKSVCSDSDIEVTLAVDSSSPVAATTYDITASVAPGLSSNVGPTTGTGLSSSAIFNDNYNNTTGGPLNVTYVVTPISADNCEGTPVNVVITIDPEPVIASNLNIIECSDTPIGLLFNTAAGSAVAVSYNVTAVNIPATVTASASNATIPQNSVSDNYLATDEYTNTTAIAVIVEYIVAPVSANGCVGDPLVINATIDPEPVVDPALDDFSCSDQAIGLNLVTNGVSVGALNYNIINVSIPGGLAASGANATIPASNVNSAYLINDSYTNTNINSLDVIYEVRGVSPDGCEGNSELISITIRPEPIVTPGIVGTVCSDQASGLTLSSLGSAVTANDYNISAVNIPASVVAGGGNAVIPANNVAAGYLSSDIYTNKTNIPINITYTVSGVSADGCEGDDETVILTVDPEPVIDPNLDDILCSGESTGLTIITEATSVGAVSFDVLSITPDPLLFAGASNVAPANGVSANYILNDEWTNNASTLPLDVVYEIRASSAAGCDGDVENITLTYNPEPVINPSLGTIVCSDLPINVNFATDGVSIGASNYNLINVVIPTGVFANGGNAVFPANAVAPGYIAADIFTNQTGSDLNVVYEVRGVSADGCESESEFITVVIQPEPVVATNLDNTICSDVPIGLILTTNGVSVAAANYNIVSVTIDPGLNPNAGNATFPANSVSDNYLSLDEYTNTTTGALSVVYVVRGISGATCQGDNQTIAITIDPEPIVNSSLDATVCSDDVSGINLLTDPASVGAPTYNLINVTIPAGLTPDIGNVTFPSNGVTFDFISNDSYNNVTNAPITAIYEVRGVSVNGCEGDSEFINLIVNPEPVIDPTLTALECSGEIIGLILGTDGFSVNAATYNVIDVTIPAALSANAGNAVFPANGVADTYLQNDIYTNNNSTVPLDVIYEVAGVSADGCLGDSELIAVTIRPEPVVTPAIVNTVCSDATASITLSSLVSSVAANDYNLISVNIPAGVTPNTGNAVFPASNVADNYLSGDIFNNVTNAAIDITYTVRGVSADGCVGADEVVVLTVNPEPVLDPNLDDVLCSGEITGVTLATNGSSETASTFDIISITPDVGLVASGGNVPVANGVASNYIFNDSYTNTGNLQLSVIYEVQPNGTNGCQGDVEFVTISYNPEPVISTSLGATVCSDQLVGVTLATNGTSIGAANYNIIDVTIPSGVVADGGNAIFPATSVADNYILNDSYTNQSSGDLIVEYEVRGVSGDGCEGQSEFIQVIIRAEPVIDPGLDLTACSDTSIGLVLDTNGISIAAANYDIISVTVDASLVAAAGNAVIPANAVANNYLSLDEYTNTTTGALNVVYEVRGVSADNCQGDAENITVTIDPEPIVNSGLDATVCSDEVSGINLLTDPASVGASNYNLVNVTIPVGLTPDGGNVIFPSNGVSFDFISNDSYNNVTNAPITVTYEVRGVSVNGCEGDSEFIDLVVDPEPVVDPNLDITICSDQPTGLIFDIDPSSVAASSYNVVAISVPPALVQGAANVVPANGIGANYVAGDVYTNTTNGSLVVIYQVQGVSADGCVGDADLISVTVNPEPVIANNLDVTVCSDDITGITLNTNGVSITADTYDLVNISIPAGLTSGAGNATFPDTGLSDAAIFNDTYNNITNGNLDVIYEVRGVSNGCTGDSEFITVTINPEPVITPNLDLIECSDVAIGLVLSTTPTSANATSYDILSITVDPDLMAAGSNATVPAAGVAANHLQLDSYENVTNAPHDVIYEVRATSADLCLSDVETITVTINPEPVIQIPAPQLAACSDQATGLVFNTDGVSVGASNYNILGLTIPGGLVADPGNVVVPATGVAASHVSGHRFTNATSGPLDVVYEVLGVSADGCLGNPVFVPVTIDAGPVVDPNLDATVCSDTPVGVIFDIFAGSVPAVSYNLVSVTPNPSLTPSGTNAVPAINQTDNYIATDTYTNTTSIPLTVSYEVRGVSASGCVGPSEFIVVTIDPEPIVDPNLDRTVCSDIAVGLILATESSSVGASVYDIVGLTIPAGVVAAGTNATVPFNGVVAGYLSGDVYTNSTGAPLDVIYEVVGVSSSTCPGNSRFITITVDPEPIIDPTIGNTVCSDETVSITLNTDAGSVAVLNYNIINKTVPGGLVQGGSNVPVPVNAVSDSYFTNDTYTNQTGASINVTYEVKPVSADGCIGDSEFIVVVINPEPVIDPSLAATVCSDDVIGVLLNTNGVSVGAATYDLVSVAPDPGLVASATNVAIGNGLAANAISNDTYTNTTSNPLDVIYTVRGRSDILDGDCLGDEGTIIVTINPEPVVNPSLDAVVCSGEIADIVLSTNGTSVAAASYNLSSVNVISGTATAQAGNAAPGGPFNQDVIRNDRFENVAAIDAVIEYRVVPVSPAGCLGEEEIILLTVQPEPVLDVLPGFNPAPVCSDLPSNITLSQVTGSVTAATFNIIGISVTSGLIPGGSNSTIQNGVGSNAIANDSYTNTTNNPLTVTYTIAPVSAVGCVGEDAQVIFTINPSPEVADLNTIACSDETSEIQLATEPGSAAAANYEVIDIRLASGLVPNGGNSTIGFVSGDIDYIRNDVFTNPTDDPLTVEYDIVPISGPGCRGPLRTIVLTIEPQPTVIPVADENICSEDLTSILLQSNTVPTSGDVTFSVTATTTDAIIGFTPFRQNLTQGSLIEDAPRNLDNAVGTLTYTITPQLLSAKNGLGCSLGTPIVVTVSVEPEPTLDFSNTFVTVCEGVSIDNVQLSTLTTPSNGNIEFVLNGDPVATGGVTGFSTSGTTFNPGDELTDVLDNPTTDNQTVTYTFTPRAVGTNAGTCIGSDVSLTVTVTPRPTVTPDPSALIPSIAIPTVELCSGESRIINLSTDVANTISEWTVTDNPDIEGEFASLGSSIFLSLINGSNVPQTLTYTVTPFSLFDNTCTGDPITINVIVNPSPEVTIADPEPTRCDGDQTGIVLDGPTPGSTFNWEAQVISGNVTLPNLTGTGTNGDVITDVLMNNGTTPAIIRYTIRASYNKVNADDPGTFAVCEGLLPGFVTLTLSPPVGASIVPDPDVGTATRFRCIGDTEAIQFSLLGAAPFTLILDKTEGGITTRETLTGLPSQHIILATESVSYSIVEVIDNNNCNATPADNVDVVFEEALADFTINGSKVPDPVTLDFNTGTATVDITLNNFNMANTYQMQIGDSTFTPPGASFQYTFTEPSPFGSIGFVAELVVVTPNAFNCNSIESFFIQVVPAEATVLGTSDIIEGCVPLVVNFESYRDDLSLSRNVIVEELTWNFDDGTSSITNPNPTHTFTEPGVYNVVVRGTNGYPGPGNEDQFSLTINVVDNPVADFRSNQDVIFIPDQAFRPINNSSTFVTDWLWDWGDGNFTSGTTDEGAATPEHVYELEGQYKVLLTASTDYGNGIVCSDTASLEVTVEEGGFTRTPNAFTPNPDGPPGGSFDPLNPGTAGNINDVFLPITEGVVEFQMVIFDRWGNLVFESNDRNFGWDGYDSKGNLFPAGVYVYRLDLLLSDGNRTTRVGDVTLIR